MEEENTYIIEKTKKYVKTKRIDEQADGNQTSSTILQNKDSINLQMNKNLLHP